VEANFIGGGNRRTQRKPNISVTLLDIDSECLLLKNEQSIFQRISKKKSVYHSSAHNLTAMRYRDEILQPHLMHVIDRQRELFQQDNARPHTARVTMDYLEQNNINVLPWPSKSANLNPIEHLWDQLDKRVRQR
jgi:hypothetical protein